MPLKLPPPPSVDLPLGLLISSERRNSRSLKACSFKTCLSKMSSCFQVALINAALFLSCVGVISSPLPSHSAIISTDQNEMFVESTETPLKMPSIFAPKSRESRTQLSTGNTRRLTASISKSTFPQRRTTISTQSALEHPDTNPKRVASSDKISSPTSLTNLTMFASSLFPSQNVSSVSKLSRDPNLDVTSDTASSASIPNYDITSDTMPLAANEPFTSVLSSSSLLRIFRRLRRALTHPESHAQVSRAGSPFRGALGNLGVLGPHPPLQPPFSLFQPLDSQLILTIWYFLI